MEHDGQLKVLPAVASGTGITFLCDDRGSILEARETIDGLFGGSLESMRGETLAGIVPREDEEAVQRGLAEARHRGASTFAVRLRARDGDATDVTISAWSIELPGTSLTVCQAAANGDPRRLAEERARRLADTQKVIATILELALQDMPLEVLLRRTLDLILWIPWLSIERTGAIFLVEDDPQALVMKVNRGLNPSLLSSCARVSFGSCLCGQAAASRSPVYAATLDEHHTTRYPGIVAHGHYCVPICSGETTLGMITTYLAPGHEPSAVDLEFLMAVADSLAGVLVRRRADGERRGLQRQLNTMFERERLGILAASAAHEFRDVMNALAASAQVLLRDLPPQDGLRATAEAMERATRRGLALTGQLESLPSHKAQGTGGDGGGTGRP